MTTTTDPRIVDNLCRLVLGRADPAGIDQTAWPALVRLAGQHGLAPLLAWRLGQAGLTAWRDAQQPALTQALRRAATYWLVLESVRQTVDAALNDAGIPVLWLKGIALALGLAFPSPAYMRWRYKLAHGWQVPFAYPYRWLDVAGEVLKTVRRRPGRGG